MTTLFESELITCADVEQHKLENITIDDSDRNIRFEFSKKVGEDLVELHPQEAEYSYTTKEFSIKFKENQIALNDQFKMKIVTV
jgi:hypothetical protein